MNRLQPTFGTGVRRGVIAAIRDDRARWLMIQRAEGLVLGGAWCFPGGGIEPDESPRAALIREVREEIGVEVEPGRRVWEWRRDDGALHLEWWTASIVSGVLRPDSAEVQQVRWMTASEIRGTPDVLPNNLAFLSYAATVGLADS